MFQGSASTAAGRQVFSVCSRALSLSDQSALSKELPVSCQSVRGLSEGSCLYGAWGEFVPVCHCMGVGPGGGVGRVRACLSLYRAGLCKTSSGASSPRIHATGLPRSARSGVTAQPGTRAPREEWWEDDKVVM